jgi:outer membrane receptor protein involved in Fe transport
VKQNLTGDTRNYGDTNADAGDQVTKRKYTDWLPSLNAVYDVNDNLKLRFAYAKTMQPLDLGSYGGGLKINTADCGASLPNVRCVTSANADGNPNLDPWRASNFDIAGEYYFGSASMLNVSAFKMKIDSFVTGGRRPAASPTRTASSAATVNVSLPIQGDGGSVKGVEVGAKLAFSDIIPDMGLLSNFGVDTNYTYSPSHESRLDLDGRRDPVRRQLQAPVQPDRLVPGQQAAGPRGLQLPHGAPLQHDGRRRRRRDPDHAEGHGLCGRERQLQRSRQRHRLLQRVERHRRDRGLLLPLRQGPDPVRQPERVRAPLHAGYPRALVSHPSHLLRPPWFSTAATFFLRGEACPVRA